MRVLYTFFLCQGQDSGVIIISGGEVMYHFWSWKLLNERELWDNTETTLLLFSSVQKDGHDEGTLKLFGKNETLPNCDSILATLGFFGRLEQSKYSSQSFHEWTAFTNVHEDVFQSENFAKSGKQHHGTEQYVTKINSRREQPRYKLNKVFPNFLIWLWSLGFKANCVKNFEWIIVECFLGLWTA